MVGKASAAVFGEISTVDDAELPVQLPDLQDYKPGDGGQSPLVNATEWLNVVDKNGRKGFRETNTMPQWAGSCWYYLRYIDACNVDAFLAKELGKYWMPVDLYVGGAEHAAGSKVPTDEVEEKNGKFFKKGTDIELKQIVAKMSKSLKNVVNPDDVVRDYGADSLCLYEMFMGPLDAVKPWQTKGIEGMNRFLGRAWRSVVGDSDEAPVFVDETAPEAIEKVMHQTVIKVTSATANRAKRCRNSFGSAMGLQAVPLRSPYGVFVKLLHPFAPHIAEEMWSILGVFCTKAALEKLAMDNDRVKKFTKGMTVDKSIVVPGKLVNIVVKPA